MIQKAKITLLGIDDELKNDESSIYTTEIKSSYFPIPPIVAPGVGTNIDGVLFGMEAVAFTTRKNTKRYRFNMNTYFNNLKLSSKSKIVIESICIPNVMSESFIQSKCVNNIVLKMKGINNTCIWDSSTKGKGSSIIFTTPILLNSQGYGSTYSGAVNPDLNSVAQKPRLNSDNNGYLFINPSPSYLYNYPIGDEFLRNGILEFELVFDVGNCWRNVNAGNQYTYVPQTLDINTDKNDLEAFMISMIVIDEEDEDSIYNEKAMLNKINKLLIDKYNK
jgi:hypothetical protein